MLSPVSRRAFLKAASLAGTAIIINPSSIFGRHKVHSSPYFGLNSFIENNPDAVFIMRTNVDVKTNAAAIKSAGALLTKNIFVSKETAAGAFPITSNIVIKPNLTLRGQWDTRYTVEGTMGVQTDCNFVEGMIESLKELGPTSNQFYIREANYAVSDLTDGGYVDMAKRTGIDFKDVSAKVGVISESDLQWVDVPGGVWFKKIPSLWPVNTSGSVLINVGKFKTHAMGMTLCAKNIQGTIAANYVRHCTVLGNEANMDMRPEHIGANADATIRQNYEHHKTIGIPRWDRPGDDGGIWQETWVTRCLDHNSVTKPLINIIEGVYGRDGHFVAGPNNGLANDYMTNILIFGKHAFYVDIVGAWLGGHEPGNFGLFHMALERGLSKYLNPKDIPLYEWKADGSAVLTSLENFPRASLKTSYLPRDYNGQTEDYWHLVNEPFDYSKVLVSVERGKEHVPDAFVLSQNYPNPFNPTTSIEFTVPRNGNVRIEIFDVTGRVVDVLVDTYMPAGHHLAVWKTGNKASGTYFYRMLYAGFSITKKMLLMR
ncbi:MAG: DUF362 domain-containing protein [Ignavibacteriales bacterium]|nr:DUF362 domain-containing protein [Ignavibacteriales bacterium]